MTGVCELICRNKRQKLKLDSRKRPFTPPLSSKSHFSASPHSSYNPPLSKITQTHRHTDWDSDH